MDDALCYGFETIDFGTTNFTQGINWAYLTQCVDFYDETRDRRKIFYRYDWL